MWRKISIVAAVALSVNARAQTVTYDPHPQPGVTKWLHAPADPHAEDLPSATWRRQPQPGAAPPAPDNWSKPGVAPPDADDDARLLRLTAAPALTGGKIRTGGTFMSASAAFAMGARLSEPMDRWGGPLSFIKPRAVGTAVYGIPMGRRWLWCLPSGSGSVWNADCFEHYAGLYRTSSISVGRDRLYWSKGGSAVRDLTIQFGPAELPPLTLTFVLRKAERRDLVIELRLLGGGQEIAAGEIFAPRDADGSAKLDVLGGEIGFRPSGDMFEVSELQAPRADAPPPMIGLGTFGITHETTLVVCSQGIRANGFASALLTC